jgi:hypothetical protein
LRYFKDVALQPLTVDSITGTHHDQRFLNLPVAGIF